VRLFSVSVGVAEYWHQSAERGSYGVTRRLASGCQWMTNELRAVVLLSLINAVFRYDAVFRSSESDNNLQITLWFSRSVSASLSPASHLVYVMLTSSIASSPERLPNDRRAKGYSSTHSLTTTLLVLRQRSWFLTLSFSVCTRYIAVTEFTAIQHYFVLPNVNV